MSAGATGALLVSQTSSVTGRQSVSLTATTTETVWQSSVGATAGGVTLTAQGGDLTLLIATVTASGSTTGTSPDQVLVQNGSNVSGNQGLSLTAGTEPVGHGLDACIDERRVTLTANGGCLTDRPARGGEPVTRGRRRCMRSQRRRYGGSASTLRRAG